jgi:hypothetical protein
MHHSCHVIKINKNILIQMSLSWRIVQIWWNLHKVGENAGVPAMTAIRDFYPLWRVWPGT